MRAEVHLTDHARKRIYERAASRTPEIMEKLATLPVSKEPPLWKPGGVKEHEYFIHIDDTTSAIVSSRDPETMRVVVTFLTLEGLSGTHSHKTRW